MIKPFQKNTPPYPPAPFPHASGGKGELIPRSEQVGLFPWKVLKPLNRFGALGLILLLALGLRILALDGRMLWYDEAFAVLFSRQGLSAMIYGTLAPTRGAGSAASDVHPLLYYTTLDGWMRLFGESPTAVRLYSVLIGVLTVAMVYVLAATLFDRRTGLVAAFITAIAPFAVQYSQETRMYVLLGLLLISATWVFVRGRQTGKAIYWISLGVLAGLSMYTQQLAAFYLLALGLIPLVTRQWKQLVPVGLSTLLAVLIYLPWLVNLPAQLGKIGVYWIPKPGLVTPVVTLWSFSFLDLAVKSSAAVGLSLIVLLMLLIFLVRSAFEYRAKKDRDTLALVGWLIAVPIISMALVSQWKSVYLTRALLPSGLMFYIALAWLFTRSRVPRLLLAGMAVLGLFSSAVGLYLHYTWNTFPRPPFRIGVQYIAANWQPGDNVVHANKLTMLPMTYYAEERNSAGIRQSYIADTPGSPEDTLALPTQQVINLLADQCAAIAVHNSPRVWFTIFQEQIDQSPDHKAPAQTWLDAHYHLVTKEAFNDLLVFLYDQPDSSPRTCEGQ